MMNSKPIVKVCGMRDTANIRAVATLQPDYMGFIFYERSSRFVGEALDVALIRSLRHEPFSIRTVGVFVNASASQIVRHVEQYDFAAAQLHGTESPSLCKQVKEESGRDIIKTFSIASEQDVKRVADYEGVIDYVLFDTATSQYGGSGTRFDWNVLSAYTDATPFFLSGGISLESTGDIKRLRHPMLYAVDINSRFETAPAMKDVKKLQQFFQQLQ